jgi:hypothetical protein
VTINILAAELIHAVCVYVVIESNEMSSIVHSHFNHAVRHWGTNNGRGYRAGTTAAARTLVCLVRCCFWRKTLAGGLTRSAGSYAFSENVHDCYVRVKCYVVRPALFYSKLIHIILLLVQY